MAANHTTKGKIINVTILALIFVGFYYAIESWREGNRRLEEASGGYTYYTPTSYQTASSARTIRRLQNIQPAAGTSR